MVKKIGWAIVDEQGRLVLPEGFAARFGFQPGVRALLVSDGDELRLLRPAAHLAKVYVELTNQCNLNCQTCIRNIWHESAGKMSEETFECILAGLSTLTPRPKVFFGGYGEPLLHPCLIEWVQRAREIGCSTELITNATLLDEAMARRLMDAGLEQLWVSLDGASPEAYNDVRLGASLPKVLANLEQFCQIRRERGSHLPQLGIAFVGMKKNIHDLPALLDLAIQFEARDVWVSNVLAHTQDLWEQVLYEKSLDKNILEPPLGAPNLRLPWTDFTAENWPLLAAGLEKGFRVRLAGQELNGQRKSCPFIAGGSMAIRWDGEISPCLPLLHAQVTRLGERVRNSSPQSYGNVLVKPFQEIWSSADYQAFRERVQMFDFSPCLMCNSCDYSLENREDCFGNILPVCGGCLWAHGLIQCP